jgi:hypothetical protein
LFLRVMPRRSTPCWVIWIAELLSLWNVLLRDFPDLGSG